MDKELIKRMLAALREHYDSGQIYERMGTKGMDLVTHRIEEELDNEGR